MQRQTDIDERIVTEIIFWGFDSLMGNKDYAR